MVLPAAGDPQVLRSQAVPLEPVVFQHAAGGVVVGEDLCLHAVQAELAEGDLQGLPDGGGRHTAARRLAGDPVADRAELAGPADHAGQGETAEQVPGVVGDDEGVGAVGGPVTVCLFEGLALPGLREPVGGALRLPRAQVLALAPCQGGEGLGVVEDGCRDAAKISHDTRWACLGDNGSGTT